MSVDIKLRHCALDPHCEPVSILLARKYLAAAPQSLLTLRGHRSRKDRRGADRSFEKLPARNRGTHEAGFSRRHQSTCGRTDRVTSRGGTSRAYTRLPRS